MEHFIQDDTFETKVNSTHTDHIDQLYLPWSENADSIEKCIETLKDQKRIVLTNHLHVTNGCGPTSSRKKTKKLFGEFFNDYLKHYTERQNQTYDRILNAIRKLFKVNFQTFVSKKVLTFDEDNETFTLLCVDISRVKQKCRGSKYTMLMRYFEFIVSDR